VGELVLLVLLLLVVSQVVLVGQQVVLLVPMVLLLPLVLLLLLALLAGLLRLVQQVHALYRVLLLGLSWKDFDGLLLHPWWRQCCFVAAEHLQRYCTTVSPIPV